MLDRRPPTGSPRYTGWMPLYEYRCAQDDSLITLLRSMDDADVPVEDPAGRGRLIERVHSVFRVDAAAPKGSFGPPAGGCGHGCGCHPG